MEIETSLDDLASEIEAQQLRQTLLEIQLKKRDELLNEWKAEKNTTVEFDEHSTKIRETAFEDGYTAAENYYRSKLSELEARMVEFVQRIQFNT